MMDLSTPRSGGIARFLSRSPTAMLDVENARFSPGVIPIPAVDIFIE
jgi:hypothetical protein